MHQQGPRARASCEKVTLEAPHFALHLNSSQLISCQLFSPNLTSSQLFASHLLSSQMSSKFLSTIFISSEHSSTWKGKLLHTEACTNMSIAVMTIIYLAFLRLMPNSHQLSLRASMQVPLSWYFININKAAQLPKTMGPHAQPQHQGTLMRPSQCDLQPRIAKRHRTTRNGTRNCRFKTGSRRQSEKKRNLGKWSAPKLRQSADNHHCNLDPATSIRFTMPTCKRPRTQPQHQGTLMQPLQGDIHCKMANAHVSTHMATQHGNIHATIPMRSVSHHVSKSPLLTTYPSHHHPKSPLPWATTSLYNISHHFPKSPLP